MDDVQLRIFEAPRFFEAFLRGRAIAEVSDITSRIYGICPVAYQMSAYDALEALLGLDLPQSLHALRRLLYCGGIRPGTASSSSPPRTSTTRSTGW